MLTDPPLPLNATSIYSCHPFTSPLHWNFTAYDYTSNLNTTAKNFGGKKGGEFLVLKRTKTLVIEII